MEELVVVVMVDEVEGGTGAGRREPDMKDG